MSARSATSTRLDVSLRGDVYNTDGDPSTFSSDGGENTRGRVLPRITGNWSWPLADWTGSWVHEVEPIVSVNLAPTWGNTRKIPNEDSSDFEFDETNLFEQDRFAGPRPHRHRHPRRLRSSLQLLGPRATEFSGEFGQSYSFTENSFFPPESGVQDNLSDYVGAFYVRPSPLLDLSYRYRLGKDDLKFRRRTLWRLRPELPPVQLGLRQPVARARGVRRRDSSRAPTRTGSNRARRSRSACG